MDVSETRPIPKHDPTPRRGCLVDGCPCQDARIVSRRKTRFYAEIARTTGETASRVIPVEDDWRIPSLH